MSIEVFIPFYGDPALLRIAVNSVRAQDSDSWKLTVVDDNYPDPDVENWFRDLEDSRVSYIKNSANLGANANYRKCVELADSEWFVMMGADDVMAPRFVSRATELAKEYPDAGIMQPGVKVIDGQGEECRTLVDTVKSHVYAPKMKHQSIMGGEQLARSLLRGDWLYFPSLVWKTNQVKDVGFRANLDVVQDLALVLDLLTRGEQMVIDSEKCFYYRRHYESDSSVRALNGKRFAEEKRYFREIAGELSGYGWPNAAAAARRHVSSRLHALTLLPRAARQLNARASRELLRHALR